MKTKNYLRIISFIVNTAGTYLLLIGVSKWQILAIVFAIILINFNEGLSENDA